jgi:hypothetical protein
MQTENCENGKTALGWCRFANRTEGKGGLVSWSLERRFYDVHSTSDTDSAMRQCLTLGGKWGAPDKGDSRAARERLKQHAEALEQKIEDIK